MTGTRNLMVGLALGAIAVTGVTGVALAHNDSSGVSANESPGSIAASQQAAKAMPYVTTTTPSPTDTSKSDIGPDPESAPTATAPPADTGNDMMGYLRWARTHPALLSDGGVSSQDNPAFAVVALEGILSEESPTMSAYYPPEKIIDQLANGTDGNPSSLSQQEATDLYDAVVKYFPSPVAGLQEAYAFVGAHDVSISTYPALGIS